MLQRQRTLGGATTSLLLISLSCSPASQGTGGQNRSADEGAIRAQIAANEAAGNRRDFQGVAATYASDGDLVRLSDPRVSGRAAIGKLIEKALATTPLTSQNRFTVESIRFLSADVAIAETTLRFSEGPLGEERGTMVMARQDGTWLIAAARVLPAEQR